jgi:hypothetical protein
MDRIAALNPDAVTPGDGTPAGASSSDRASPVSPRSEASWNDRSPASIQRQTISLDGGPQAEGRPGWLTEPQEATLAHFREAFASVPLPRGWANDDTMCRFLRARNWKLDDATLMLNNTLKWRQEFPYEGGAEALLSFVYPEEQAVRETFPQAFHRTDKYGRPVLIQCVGCVDAQTLGTVTSFDKLLCYFIYRLEHTIHLKYPACSARRVLCYAMPRCAMLCDDVLCYAVLCYMPGAASGSASRF